MNSLAIDEAVRRVGEILWSKHPDGGLIEVMVPADPEYLTKGDMITMYAEMWTESEWARDAAIHMRRYNDDVIAVRVASFTLGELKLKVSFKRDRVDFNPFYDDLDSDTHMAGKMCNDKPCKLCMALKRMAS